MLTTNKLLPQGQGLSAVLLKRAARVALDWGMRQKSHFDATDTQGRSLGVSLPRGTVVHGGDVLVAQDGSLIVVQAAPQAVLVVTHCTEHGSPLDLLRAAYHLGNHHVPLELQPDHLKLEPDQLLADMLRSMHLTVREATEAFEPEGPGQTHAAGSAHAHQAHAHAHGPAHDHDQPPATTTAGRGKPLGIAINAAAAPHVHGPGCKHGH